MADRHRVDHLVLPVRDLAVAAARLKVLGFTVAPQALHPFGTENACVFFRDGTYLEPLTIADRVSYIASVERGDVFTGRDQAFRRSYGQEGFLPLWPPPLTLVPITGDSWRLAYRPARSSNFRGPCKCRTDRQARRRSGLLSRQADRLRISSSSVVNACRHCRGTVLHWNVTRTEFWAFARSCCVPVRGVTPT